jgi:hypothetical protein
MKKVDLIYLYINFRIWLLQLIGYQKLNFNMTVYEREIDARYFDEISIIWFNPNTGKKLSTIISSTKEQSYSDPKFKIDNIVKFKSTCSTNTGMFRFNKCRYSPKDFKF